MELSKRRVDKAGDLLRALAEGATVTENEEAEALQIVERFRVAHASALDLSAFELNMLTQDMNIWREVARRLKRLDTLRGKLVREPALKLSRMRDIAGCRMSVPLLNDMFEASDRVVFGISAELVRVVDYVEQPRPRVTVEFTSSPVTTACSLNFRSELS